MGFMRIHWGFEDSSGFIHEKLLNVLRVIYEFQSVTGTGGFRGFPRIFIFFRGFRWILGFFRKV